MSLFDIDISKSIWNGKIPIKITLDPTEIDVYGKDKIWDPIYLEASRCSYFPLITKHLHHLFSELGMQVSEEAFQSIWYEYNNKPLKWHYPIGLLFDLHSKSTLLPWPITLHFKDLPTNDILLKPTLETMHDMFMSMVKEADFLRYGSTKKVMNLSKYDSTQLWQSLIVDRFEDFRAVNKQLIEYSNQLQHIPLRIYLPENCPIIQELVPFHSDTEKEIIPTIGDILKRLIPDLFIENELDPNIEIIIHGIELPLDTPVHWAYENLSFADNFLHIVIRKK
ncbi:autophagy protein Apg5-domain-containing protein [Cokeromyces recurvatus]|uniref:autophagy protein Apg5-domain-containing protein n=1 Tax=Cokeromyces recurvatus TaxID=90255 RepID=UPI00222093F3|nr:autophagy protein Apg5-domain-containing protein [Cokeromyces recurvatus]KAI7906481.1 autophagy protein Apg5-domain-containing protein [Cokeromyces recurvatus]